jgi:hypothetical protein
MRPAEALRFPLELFHQAQRIRGLNRALLPVDEGKRVNDEREREDVPAGRGHPDAKGSDGQGRRQADATALGQLAFEQGEAPASAGLASSQFRSLSLTDSKLRRLRDWEVVDLLIEAGSSRLTAERMVEIERGEAEPGRARRHTARR